MVHTTAHTGTEGKIMRLHFLGKGGSDGNGCPSLYATDQDTYLVQGWGTNAVGTVEIPHLLTGFAEPDTFIGSPMTDTGRGTFQLTGRPISDTETLRQLDLADDETAIEVPKRERTFYGGISDR
ncbi:hypothetical protein [Nocardia nova]|uniref:hypothetical protein n=1 Tax=Nocardia nova TaxID=37330 RepID=UPI0033E08758